MADIEKVINGLEHCSDRSCKCNECAYWNPNRTIGDEYCGAEVNRDALELLKEQQPRLLTFEEVKDHYSVPVSKLQIEKYNDYAEDIKPLYFEFHNPDGWVVHWRGYDKVSAYLREWEKDYGRTWRCWTDKPTDEQSKAEPWKDGEQE